MGPAFLAGLVLALAAFAADAAEIHVISGGAARSFVEQHWTWEAHFEQQLEVFRDVAAGRA